MFPTYTFDKRATILQASYFTRLNPGEGLTGGKLMLGAILRSFFRKYLCYSQTITRCVRSRDLSTPAD